jgi:hypothetical protein
VREETLAIVAAEHTYVPRVQTLLTEVGL